MWLVVNDRKFLVGTVFFSHINQLAVFLHEPTTKRTNQPNRLSRFANNFATRLIIKYQLKRVKFQDIKYAGKEGVGS